MICSVDYFFVYYGVGAKKSIKKHPAKKNDGMYNMKNYYTKSRLFAQSGHHNGFDGVHTVLSFVD